jgi:hypothetical protein
MRVAGSDLKRKYSYCRHVSHIAACSKIEKIRRCRLMEKLTFVKIRKTLAILLLVCFLVPLQKYLPRI